MTPADILRRTARYGVELFDLVIYRIARLVIYARFGRRYYHPAFGWCTGPTDCITDYLERSPPDWRGAWRAWQVFAELD